MSWRSHLEGRRSSRGVSLIEALVAMTVVGIGMVSLVGVQGHLRFNADVSKQRSEAIRLGQNAIETARAFSDLSQYDSLADLTDPPVTIGNASYTVARTVNAGAAPMQAKSMSVTVSWNDRTGEMLSVRLNTWLAGISAELGASLSLAPAGGPTRGPGGRSVSIPRPAVDLNDGTSALQVPGGGNTVWRFQNLTAEVQVCSLASGLPLTAANLTGCSGRALLYSGFVRASLGPLPDAANPGDAVDPGLTLALVSTAPTNNDGQCFAEDLGTSARAFYCIVPLITPPGATPTVNWSGRVDFGPPTLLQTNPPVADPDRRKVCRYLQTVAPLANVSRPLINQNYLVIEGSASCPAGTTAHQP